MTIEEIKPGIYTHPRPTSFETGPSMIKLYKYGLKLNDEVLEHAVLARFVEQAHIHGRWVGIEQGKLIEDITRDVKAYEDALFDQFKEEKQQEELDITQELINDLHAEQAERFGATYTPVKRTKEAPQLPIVNGKRDPLAAHLAGFVVDEYDHRDLPAILSSAESTAPLLAKDSLEVRERSILFPTPNMVKEMYALQQEM
ncbi:MAG: hypothetical protein QF486_03670 [Candidatus Woesearchaeota archaeon]|jgi:hypothetical protein|nr:hypothetical protein [Candidatus Woesearchaeota archaeon]MDP7182099.1 hypothetical protein [Candidatus Woesearchaeota archaeon]MDP7198695.1 hypothetical protein [Candidatus Woesearchaeota archaeon]MDP7467669.1 hypothetical protein [Candidatus Woesearchaeota archaeon]MDP7647238.1 hypothetical protein [Candidatus Woesearchaeota archaeon]